MKQNCPLGAASCENPLQASHEVDSLETIPENNELHQKEMTGNEHAVPLSPATLTILRSCVFRSICIEAEGYLQKHSAEGLSDIIAAIKEIAITHQPPLNPHIARRMIELFTKIESPNPDYHLSVREKDILENICNGLTEQEVADKLFISHFTVNTHIKHIYAKLHVHTRTGLIAKILREHLITI